jgi:hypothetical protein
VRSTEPPVQRVPGYIPGGSRLGRGVDNPPLHSSEVKNGYAYTFTLPLSLSLSVNSWHVIWRTLTLVLDDGISS